MSRVRRDKAAREQLKKEAALYEQTAFFIMKFGLTGVLGVACDNILKVVGELEDMAKHDDDVSWMIHENRSKVENELIYICDKSNYDIQIKQAFKDFLVHFKQGDLTKCGIYSLYSPQIETIPTGKGKAPQLTKLRMQQQKDDDDKPKVYLGKMEKLYKESDDYDRTLVFMESFIDQEQLTNEEQHNLLLYAYENVLAVDHDLENIIASGKELSDRDLSLIVKEYRSKIENELQGICDNVSNLTVEEAYARHLKDFKTGFKLSAQDHHHSHLQNEDGKIMSSKPKMSVKKKKKKSKLRLRGKGSSGSCKTPSPVDIHLYMNDYVEDHSKCCMRMKKNHLETSYVEWHIDRMNSLLKEEEYPEQEYVVFDDGDFDDHF